jgi:hypothetical protein
MPKSVLRSRRPWGLLLENADFFADEAREQGANAVRLWADGEPFGFPFTPLEGLGSLALLARAGQARVPEPMKLVIEALEINEGEEVLVRTSRVIAREGQAKTSAVPSPVQATKGVKG